MNAFIPPPMFAVLAIPFALLPWTLAVVLWNLVCVSCFAGSLYLVGVRDWRLFVLASCSFPFVSSLGFGQTEGPLALGIAAAWRWRTSPSGAIAVGAVVAAKLLVWPLIIWLLLTRGLRATGLALASAAALLGAGWACIGFKGLLAYPSLLVADAHAFEERTHSITSGLMRLGASIAPAQMLAVLIACLVVIATLRGSGSSERSLFLTAIAFSLLSSPLLEMHYITLLLIPLAIVRPRLDLLWLFAINVFWLSPLEPPRTVWQIALVLLSVTVVVMRAHPGAAPSALRR
jgi:alpha-1,2-mannosyltransferase